MWTITRKKGNATESIGTFDTEALANTFIRNLFRTIELANKRGIFIVPPDTGPIASP